MSVKAPKARLIRASKASNPLDPFDEETLENGCVSGERSSRLPSHCLERIEYRDGGSFDPRNRWKVVPSFENEKGTWGFEEGPVKTLWTAPFFLFRVIVRSKHLDLFFFFLKTRTRSSWHEEGFYLFEDRIQPAESGDQIYFYAL